MGKTKLLVNCFRNRERIFFLKKKYGMQPAVDGTLKPIKRSGVKHRVGKVIPHSLSMQESPNNLLRSTPWYFKLQWMSCRRRSGMSNSSRSWWNLAEQIVIRVRINLVEHTKPCHTTSMTQWQETLIRAKPGHDYTCRLRSWRQHSATDPHIGEQYSMIWRINA